MLSRIISGAGYYLVYPFIYLLSVSPFWLLYLFSDVLYVLFFYVVGYRKEIVILNLRNAFPEKNEQEIKALGKQFFKYLCDLFLETFKTLSISKKDMLKHCFMTESARQTFAKHADEGKNVIIVMGHFGNWEWSGNTFSMECKQQLFVIYHALSNKYFDGLMYKMRTRFGTKLFEMNDTLRSMISNRKTLNATAFIADQTPSASNAYWTTFLNQDTPIFWGTEKIARKLNYPIVYVSVKKIKRGYYNIFAETIVEEPDKTTEGEISEIHTRRLEKDILEQPETWLWSHRRWKYKRQETKP
ncbi:MAG TPA: lysophospholipid acyltransferase family protein [Puia sp.]|nr:lysophospholipid acyltransferase family protein [Puia sp.]